MTDSRPAGRRRSPTRHRVDTRARLLDAAFEVFAAKGFGLARIDDICAAAGYTKGAFYSNFASLEELFFALYDRESVNGATTTTEAIELPDTGDPVDVIRYWARTVRIDRAWLLINTDFVSYAARYPEIAEALAAHRRRLREQMVSDMAAFIAQLSTELPASLPTPLRLARAVLSVYDGVIYQLLLDLDEDRVRAHLVDVLTALVSTDAVPRLPDDPY